MTETPSDPHTDNTESNSSQTTHYASFILRCWQDAPSEDAPPSRDGAASNAGDLNLRARLVDVNSGISYPVANLNQLPALLWQRLRQMMFRLPVTEVSAEDEEQDNVEPMSYTVDDVSPEARSIQ